MQVSKSKVRGEKAAEVIRPSIRVIGRLALAEQLGVSPWTLWRWSKAGLMPAPLKKLGKHSNSQVVWRESDIAEWLDKRSQRPSQ